MVNFFNSQNHAYQTLQSNGIYKNKFCAFTKTDIKIVRNSLLVDLLIAGADILSIWKRLAYVGEDLLDSLLEIMSEVDRRMALTADKNHKIQSIKTIKSIDNKRHCASLLIPDERLNVTANSSSSNYEFIHSSGCRKLIHSNTRDTSFVSQR